MDIYIVQPGDDIYYISEKFGVTVTKLIRDNGLENPYDLVVGQAIVITYPKQTHTVQDGDTLTSIADAYGVTPMQLLRNNPYLNDQEFIYPGETIVISYNTNGKIETHAFTYPYINRAALRKALPNLTYLSIFNYRVTEEGDIIAYYDDTEIIQLTKAYRVAPIMMATTLTPQGEPNLEAAYSVLLNEEYTERFIDNMLTIMKAKGFYGINIIFNFMTVTNQNLYVDLLYKVANRIGSEGYLLIITINYNIQNVDNELSFEQIDYSSFDPLVNDMVFLKLYWGKNSGPPSPIISIYESEVFLDYLVPLTSPDKIILGVPLISYNWELPYIPGKSSASSLSLNSYISLANYVDATIQFDEVSQTPFFQYYQYSFDASVENIVWSIDARSIDALLKLISEYGLKGIGLWNIMIYYPQIWLIINSQFEIQNGLHDPNE
ncbi:MAG: hypothetical protein K0S76_1960 [Herbinix sp.]|jgi:spore germination protein|nr:hypothetical protein [Herbinix sp.]